MLKGIGMLLLASAWFAVFFLTGKDTGSFINEGALLAPIVGLVGSGFCLAISVIFFMRGSIALTTDFVANKKRIESNVDCGIFLIKCIPLIFLLIFLPRDEDEEGRIGFYHDYQ